MCISAKLCIFQTQDIVFAQANLGCIELYYVSHARPGQGQSGLSHPHPVCGAGNLPVIPALVIREPVREIWEQWLWKKKSQCGVNHCTFISKWLSTLIPALELVNHFSLSWKWVLSMPLEGCETCNPVDRPQCASAANITTSTLCSCFGNLTDLQLRSKCQNCWVYFLIALPITLLWKQYPHRDEQGLENTETWVRWFTSNFKATLTRKKGGKKGYKPVPVRQMGELNSFQLTSCLVNGSLKVPWAYRKRKHRIQSLLIHTAFLVSGSHDAIPTKLYLANLGSCACMVDGRIWPQTVVFLKHSLECCHESCPATFLNVFDGEEICICVHFTRCKRLFCGRKKSCLLEVILI